MRNQVQNVKNLSTKREPDQFLSSKSLEKLTKNTKQTKNEELTTKWGIAFPLEELTPTWGIAFLEELTTKGGIASILL